MDNKVNFSKSICLPNDSILEDYVNSSHFEVIMHLHELCNAAASQFTSISILNAASNDYTKFRLCFADRDNINRFSSYLTKFNGNTRIYSSKYAIEIEEENNLVLIVKMYTMPN